MHTLQLIELSRHIFDQAALPSSFEAIESLVRMPLGMIEVLTDAISIDALKKRQHVENAAKVTGGGNERNGNISSNDSSSAAKGAASGTGDGKSESGSDGSTSTTVVH